MSKTFSIRREEVVAQSPAISVLKERWPALFTEAQIKEEFRRITTIALEETFLRHLDGYTPRLVQLMRNRGGAAAIRMRPFLSAFDRSQNVDKKRDAVVCGLMEYQRENHHELFQDCQNDYQDYVDQPMKLLVIHNFTAGDDPEDVAIIIEGIQVLNGCRNRTKACALLMGLIYALNLQYPKNLKYTFEVFQKVFLELDKTKLLKKVCSLRNKLLE